MALSFGWLLFGVICPIVLAQLIAVYSIPGFCCLLVKLPGLTIRCLNWSFGSNPASKPWNLLIAVTQAVIRGQYVTVQHDCLGLHVLVIMAMGMCWSMTMIKLSELTCFLWLSCVDFWSFNKVIVLEIFPFSKIFPNGITIISMCYSLFCVTHPMVEFLLVILCLENLLPRSLANGCVLCHWVHLACLDILFQRQSL